MSAISSLLVGFSDFEADLASSRLGVDLASRVDLSPDDLVQLRDNEMAMLLDTIYCPKVIVNQKQCNLIQYHDSTPYAEHLDDGCGIT